MSKKLKTFFSVFILVGIAVFFMYYYSTGDIYASLALAVIGGIVVGLIISLAIPFIKKK